MSLKQALRHFVISPLSAIEATSNMSMKPGYVKQCGVQHVTVELIAYTAIMVLLRFPTADITNAMSRFASV